MALGAAAAAAAERQLFSGVVLSLHWRRVARNGAYFALSGLSSAAHRAWRWCSATVSLFARARQAHLAALNINAVTSTRTGYRLQDGDAASLT